MGKTWAVDAIAFWQDNLMSFPEGFPFYSC